MLHRRRTAQKKAEELASQDKARSASSTAAAPGTAKGAKADAPTKGKKPAAEPVKTADSATAPAAASTEPANPRMCAPGPDHADVPTVEVLRAALANVMPTLGCTPVRKGASVYQVPVPLGERRRRSLAIKWIIGAARSRKGKPMSVKLFEEINDALAGEVRDRCRAACPATPQGAAFKKKTELHKQAESNRAYAHLKWN